ncbi:MAG: hypothetical protein N2053_12870 [Chitinispirillaceae bacterium]|nr:hypothetical protein [Chitinispirillaceae bacterium]
MDEIRSTFLDKIIINSERDKYLDSEKDFIDDALIKNLLMSGNKPPDKKRVDEILEKSLSISTLSPEECAELCRVEDRELLQLMEETALNVKKKVYDKRDS